MKMRIKPQAKVLVLAGALLLLCAAGAQAKIDGVVGSSFSLTAKAGHIITGEGNSLAFWGFANGNGLVQYPGPTMIVTQGQTVTVKLTNQLSMPVSILFPGQEVTVAPSDPGTPGLLAREAQPGGTVTYTFTPTTPGTFLYHSGTRPEVQVEMGLLGAMIVRPAASATMTGCDPANPAKSMFTAFGSCSTAYDYEYLFLVTEMDPVFHNLVDQGRMEEIDNTAFFPPYWFLNGRNGPDTLSPANAAWMPNQPYNCFPRMKPGGKVLLRVLGGGRDLHPFHTHGNNFDIIARDGHVLESTPGAVRADTGLPDLAVSDFTLTVEPGATVDAIFQWTGKGLGWDIYGPISTTCTDANNDGLDDATGQLCHDATCTDLNPVDGFDDATREYCADHGKPFPVILPDVKDLLLGAFYSGSPFLGAAGFLPPGEGGLNPNAGFFFMWHSHSEKELTNNNIFPGGMMSMLVIEPPRPDIIIE